MNRKVIYTAIFGGKDKLHEPLVTPAGHDFVCFTDDRSFQSSVWQIRRVAPPFNDPVRSARQFKVLPHRFLPEYDISVWIDGNLVVTSDIGEIENKYLVDASLAVYNHSNQKRRIFKLFWIRDRSLARNCIYKEAKNLLEITERGDYVDNPELIRNQMERYRREGYPRNNGLAVTSVLLRRHNDERLKRVMESWWNEIKNNSRRDQLSFNYVVWKESFDFNYIDGDLRYGKYFCKVNHSIKKHYKG